MRSEIGRALGVVFGGTVALAFVGALLPVIAAWIQALLAALLIATPIVVLRGGGKTVDDFGVDFGRPMRTTRITVLTMLVISPPFLLGHHLLQSALFERSADWSLANLERWDEALRDAPDAPCERAASTGEVFVWTQRSVIWIVSPPDQRLEATITSQPVIARPVTCTERGPVASGSVNQGDDGRLTVESGRGLFLDVGEAKSWELHLSLDGAPVEARALKTGAFSTSAEQDGHVTGSKSLWWLLTFLVVHLGLVALPEEWFFRGYLQGRLDERFGTPWRIGGVACGPGLVLASVAFTLLHPILIPGVHRLLVFFPSLLFGWLRARTGNIGAAVWVHALCNLLQAVTIGMYY